MMTATRQRVFPLHLTSIEKFLWTDDRPRYPMAFVVQLALSGTMDRGAFDAALEGALKRHPLLVSLIRPAKRKADCWVSSDGLMPPVDWAGDDVPVTCPVSESIDLRHEVGLRIWVRQAPDRVRLITQFHHACCDGIGAYRFLGDLLALYGVRTATEELRPSLHPVDLTRLRGRANGCMDLARTNQRALLTRRSVAQGLSVIGRGCTPLHPSKLGLRGQRAPFPGICSHSFDRAEHKQLRDAAGKMGGMVNDLLLRELFYTMQQWNQAQRPLRPGRRFRIMMPVDLRETEDYETPASNIMGYTFITRNARQLRDPERLAHTIREETAVIKHDRLGKRFVDTITGAANIRGLLPLLLSLPRTLATVIHSNVGDPSRRFTATFPRKAGRTVCGNLTLDEITGVPPIRPKTRATLSTFTYNRMLTISLRCDPHLFSLDDTQELLSIYIKRLGQHLKTTS